MDKVEKFNGKSKDTCTKLFLNSNLNILKVFQLLPGHVNTKIMHNLEVHSLQFDIQIKRLKKFQRFDFCMSQQIYSQSKKRSQ